MTLYAWHIDAIVAIAVVAIFLLFFSHYCHIAISYHRLLFATLLPLVITTAAAAYRQHYVITPNTRRTFVVNAITLS